MPALLDRVKEVKCLSVFPEEDFKLSASDDLGRCRLPGFFIHGMLGNAEADCGTLPCISETEPDSMILSSF
jgi:hypothetical protein